MIISIIVAMAENRVIGRDNSMPWDIPAELKHFKAVTMGHHLIMGRKTFESIGAPLPGRKTVVLTRNENFRPAGVEVASSLRDALEMCGGEGEVFICGGGEVFGEALPLASRIYLTVVHMEAEGDVLFPVIPDDFVEAERKEITGGAVPCTFILLERIRGKQP